MPNRDIVVIGASAGGLEAVKSIAKGLPPDFPAAVFVIIHIPMHGTSRLPQILSKCGTLRAQHSKDRDAIHPGRIFVAPPNYHMLIKRGFVALSDGPPANGFRPAIDPLFRSAAKSYGKRVIGVVLSGMMDDGTEGLHSIKQRGGISLVQSPSDAVFPSMPQSAIDHGSVDYIKPTAEIADLLIALTRQKVTDNPLPSKAAEELDVVERKGDGLLTHSMPGELTPLTCPNCNGTLWEIDEGNLTRYQCHVGHSYSLLGLLSAQEQTTEETLWSAFRALNENAELLRRLVDKAPDQKARRTYLKQAKDVIRRAVVVRDLIAKSVGRTGRPARRSVQNSESFPWK